LKSVDELASTERLLEQIRKKTHTDSEATYRSRGKLPIKSLFSSWRNVFAFRKTITFGVDIDDRDLK